MATKKVIPKANSGVTPKTRTRAKTKTKTKIVKTTPVKTSVKPITTSSTITESKKCPVVNKKKKFEYKRLSSTMMKTFLQCKRKFHKNYIERITEPANTSFSLGNACHFGLEKANLALIKHPHVLTVDEIEGFVQEFRNYLATRYVSSMELFDVGEELVRDELVNLDYNVKIIKAEGEFDVITPEGVRLYGFIDKIEEMDSETIKITDYKTSVMPMSHEEAKVDAQLSMYELAAAIIYPQYKKRLVCLKYLRTGKELVTTRSPIAQLNFRKQLLAVHLAIQEYMCKFNDTKAVSNGVVNGLCNWCSYRVDCPEYLTQIEKVEESYPTIENMTDALFVKEYTRVGIVDKALKEYKDKLKLWGLRRVEENPEEVITDGERIANTLSTTRKSYDPRFVAKYVSYEQFVGLVSMNNSKIKKFLNTLQDEDHRIKLEQSAEVKFNSPQFRFKKV